MKLPVWFVDAFCTSEPFSGNPAAVCLLDRWLADGLMQSIAAQHNLSETAFLLREGDAYSIRWFSPSAEVRLCGHATLASGFVVRAFVEPGVDEVRFVSAGGRLRVLPDAEHDLSLELTADPPIPMLPPLAGLGEVLGVEPVEVVRGLMCPIAILPGEEDVRSARVEIHGLAALTPRLAITAPGKDVDFVSRFFAPDLGVAEDPVTGSAHAMLVPLWSRRLARPRLHARQLSARGGELFCEDGGDRVRLAGRTRLYLRGEIEL